MSGDNVRQVGTNLSTYFTRQTCVFKVDFLAPPLIYMYTRTHMNIHIIQHKNFSFSIFQRSCGSFINTTIIVHNFIFSSPKSTLSLLFLNTYLSPFLYMKMKEKAIILLFMLLFAFSCSLPSTTAVPSSSKSI